MPPKDRKAFRKRSDQRARNAQDQARWRARQDELSRLNAVLSIAERCGGEPENISPELVARAYASREDIFKYRERVYEGETVAVLTLRGA